MSPVPAEPSIPRFLAVGDFALASLGRDDLGEDFEAVVESTELLAGLLGDDWPAGLTLEQDLADLCWHEDETRRGSSFAWAIRDIAGAYVGCAYLKPALTGSGWRAPYWFRRGFDDRVGIERFDHAWRNVVEGWVDPPVEIIRRSVLHRR